LNLLCAHDPVALSALSSKVDAEDEIAGVMGSSARVIRASEIRGCPWTLRSSNRVIGRKSLDVGVWWRDDMPSGSPGSQPRW
jgi:hypothetical protein